MEGLEGMRDMDSLEEELLVEVTVNLDILLLQEGWMAVIKVEEVRGLLEIICREVDGMLIRT